MSRIFAPACAAVLGCLFTPAALAQDPAVAEELKALRAQVEKQSRNIDALSEQIAKLRISLEKQGAIPLGGAVPVATATPVPTPGEPPKPEKPEFSADVPKAEAADGKRHVVIKGETLTSIAKHYNLTLTELKKANKEVDERKLQIGQTLTIPPSKSAEPPAKKDE